MNTIMNKRKWSNDSKQKVLEAVIYFIQSHGYSPSVREICDRTGLTSTSTVHHHIMSLVDEGKLNIGGYGESRTISVPGYEFVKVEEEKG